MNSNAFRSSIVSKALWGLLASAGLLGIVIAQAGQPAKADAGGKTAANKYIGAEKCKNCHQAQGSGDQFGAWQKTSHAQAFATLAGAAAKEFAKAKGIEDPQKSDQCLECHTTAFGVEADRIKKGFDAKLGVQCESCHGPGEQHMKARLAAVAKAGGGEGFGDEKADAAAYQKIPDGEILTQVDQKTCLGCHNERSPTFKPFCFHERSAAISHRDPRKPHTAEEMLVCGCEKCECVHGCEAGKCGVAKKEKK